MKNYFALHFALQRPEEKKGFISSILNFFSKTDLDKKLAVHGLKTKLDRSAKRRVQQISKSSPLILQEELNVLSMETLFQLRTILRNKTYLLKCELKDLQIDKLMIKKENTELRKEFKDLEQTFKTILKPWKNRYPDSDELTRAYLIN